MNIFIIGGSGLVGSRVFEVLKDKHVFTELSRSSGVDITKPESLALIEQDTDHEWVILYAAKTDVDGCEYDKDLGENGEAWKINVEGVRNVVAVCQKAHKKLVYISTDLIFDGERGNYVETDRANPQNWYGVTKAKGEEIVGQSDLHYLILRIAFPYTFFGEKKHFVQAMHNRLATGQPIKGVTDEIFTPTWLDDLAVSLDILFTQNAKGIFHIGGLKALTPYNIAQKIAEVFDFDKHLISQTTRAEYFSGKATRPFNTSINSDKIKELGVQLTSFTECLEKIASSLRSSQ